VANKNSFAIISKKYQQDEAGKFVKEEGQFKDTESDFDLFKKYNTEAIQEAINYGKPLVISKGGIATGKSALPLRFAEWLNNHLAENIGIKGSIKENKTTGYKGYGIFDLSRVVVVKTETSSTSKGAISFQQGYKLIPDALYQIEDNTENRAVAEELNNNITDFLDAIGVTINKTKVITNKLGTVIPQAVAMAQLTEMTLDVIEGRMDITTLPEEAAHFYISMLDKTTGLYKTMYENIVNYPEYSKVKEQYKNLYTTEVEFRQEAIGKVIATRIVEGFDAYSNRQQRQVETWWNKIWNYIKSMFSKVKTDEYAIAAHDIMSNNLAKLTTKQDTSTQNIFNKQQVIDALIAEQNPAVAGMLKSELLATDKTEFNDIVKSAGFNSLGSYWTRQNVLPEMAQLRKSKKEVWGELPATPKGNYKFLYNISEAETNSTYRMLLKDFDESDITIIPIKHDTKYHSKIAIKAPREAANEAAFKAEDIAQSNIQEFYKENYPVTDSLFMANFDLYYPEMSHKTVEEKEAFIDALTMGEIEQICGI